MRDIEHGGVTDEDIEKFFRDNPGIRPINPLNGADPNQPVEFHAGDGRPVPPSTESGDIEIPEDLGTTLPLTSESATSAPVEEATTPPVADVTEPTAAETTDGGFVTIGDTQVPQSQVEAWLAFQQEINGDPVLQRLIVDHLTGRQAATQAPVAGAPAAAQATPPPAAVADPIAAIAADLDLDDPSVKALYGLVQQQQQQLASLAHGLQLTHETTQSQQRAQTESLYKRASESFKVAKKLEDKDVEDLSRVAARLGVLPQLLKGIDPITGAPSRPDPLTAIERALEIAYLAVPEYRQRDLSSVVDDRRTAEQKKKALAAISGSSGSTPRTQPKPRTQQETRAAMIGEVAQMLTGSWADAN